MTVQGQFEKFWEDVRAEAHSQAVDFPDLLKGQVKGINASGWVKLEFPADDPASDPETDDGYWPVLAGVALAVDEWVWVLARQDGGYVVLGRNAQSNGEGGSSGLPPLAEGLHTGDDPLTDYPLGISSMGALGTDPGWPTSDNYNVITVHISSSKGNQVALLGAGTRQYIRRWNGSTQLWGAWSETGAEAAGIIKMYGGSSAPAGYLICNGSVYDPVAYPELFAAIGTTYGGTSGSPLLPNFKGRVPLGVGTGDASDATDHTLGEKEGTEKHTLTAAQMPSHNHGGNTGSDGSHSHQLSANQNTNTTTGGTATRLSALTSGTSGEIDQPTTSDGSHNHTISVSGSDSPHNNLQPSLAINFIIKT